MLDAHSLAERATNKPNGEERNPTKNLKAQVLEFLQKEGPSYPVKISQGVGRESFFVGAVLSELTESKTIKLSNAKVGGSRVYYVPGQEEKLEILYDYLPDAEKKAYDLLKEKEVIKAKETTPVMRVALSSIPDFSKPINVNGEPAWQWYLSKELPTQIKQPITKVKQIPVQVKTIKRPEENQTKIVPETKPSPKTKKEDTFSKDIETFFSKSNIKILEKEIVRKNSESNFVIKIASQIGPLEMFVCAKNKKKVSDQDIMLAHQKGQNKKMPTLFLTTGEQTKKSKEYLEKTLKGFMIFKKI
ncbi:hypothetical protein HOF78_02815 [Candidatus Woesearchaeota archaeon]|jgi:hypothetical protein|nr:hypothetical protein [Candidatus Woesearchaeota archaeon]MBT6044665.1 hypothetical protein [Candidatus Woesearchaeota archaeon]